MIDTFKSDRDIEVFEILKYEILTCNDIDKVIEILKCYPDIESVGRY